MWQILVGKVSRRIEYVSTLRYLSKIGKLEPKDLVRRVLHGYFGILRLMLL